MKICHASLDENKRVSGGELGDQTGTEVYVRSWYSKPWTAMFRYKNAKIAKIAAAIAVKLAKSNLVGYDQSNRNSLYKELELNNWDVDAYIKSGVLTEADCSSFVYACYCCVIAAMRSSTNAPTTSMVPNLYPSYGFTGYYDSAYLDSDAKLQEGDILVKPGSHVVIVVGEDENVNSSIHVAPNTSTIVNSHISLSDYSHQASNSTSTKVEVTSSMLNIRKDPNAQALITGLAKNRETYEITEIKNGWGKLANGKGWFNLKYTKSI